MAITMRKNRPVISADEFIGGAPDAVKRPIPIPVAEDVADVAPEVAPTPVAAPEAPVAVAPTPIAPAAPVEAKAKPARTTKRKIGNKNILSVSMDPELVNRLDDWAKERGMSRAAALAFATSKLLKLET